MSCRVRFNFFKMGDREEARHRCCDSQLFEGELLDTPLLEIPFNFEEFMKSELARIYYVVFPAKVEKRCG